MDSDDISPAPRRSDPLAALVREDLDRLSVAELDERVAALEAEIARVRAHQTKSVSHRASAEALFRK